MQTTPATTAINSQLLQSLIALGPLIDRMCSNDSGSERWESTKQVADQARAAVQAAIHQNVLEELILAHKIIQNALALMSHTQKDNWAELNERSGCNVGIGTVRANNRLHVIQCAGGSL